jgi:hypothetical protein
VRPLIATLALAQTFNGTLTGTVTKPAGAVVPDVGFIKNNPFYRDGRLNLQFRSEFFNPFNHVRFGDPGLTYGTLQSGVVTSQATTRG